VTDAWSSIELDGFERIETAAGTSLLRVAARLPSDESLAEDPTLVIDDGERLHRLPALPSQPAPAGELAVSYSVADALLRSARGFSLEFADLAPLPLPEPAVTSGALGAPRQAIDELARQLQELRADAEQRLAQATAAQAQALARLAELEVEREAGQAIGAELHARLAEAAGPAEQLAAVTAQRDRLTAQLAGSSEAQTRLDGRMARLVSELSIAAAARIDAEEAVTQLQAEIAEARADRRDAELKAEEDRSRALSFADRASALEVELAAARDAGAVETGRATRTQSELESTRAQVAVLESEQARLEHRVTGLAEELAGARAARIETETATIELQSELMQARTELEQVRHLGEQQRARADGLAMRIPDLERGRDQTSERLGEAQAALAVAEQQRAALAVELEQAQRLARDLEARAQSADHRVAEIEAHLGRSSIRLATLVTERHEAERERRQLATELEDARQALQLALAGAHGSPPPDVSAHALTPDPAATDPPPDQGT